MAIEFWVRVSFARIHGCFCTFSGISSFAQNCWPKIPNCFYSIFCAFSAKCVCFTRRFSSQAINENIYWANTKTNKLHFCKKMNKKQYLFAIYLYLFIQFSQFRIRRCCCCCCYLILSFCLENGSLKKTLNFIQTTERIYTVIGLHKLENMKSRMAKNI